MRSDRFGRRKGGRCVYIRENMETKEILKYSNSYVDSITTKIPKMNLLLMVLYCSPLRPTEKFERVISIIRGKIKKL